MKQVAFRNCLLGSAPHLMRSRQEHLQNDPICDMIATFDIQLIYQTQFDCLLTEIVNLKS